MAVNKATQDNLTAWKKKLLSKGGYTVPEYDDDEQLAKRNDYESVHRLMVNRGQVEEWGERGKRDVSSYAFSTKNAKGVKPSSAAQRVEAPDFSTENSGGITRTEKNSPTKSSGIPFAANTGFSMGGKTPVFMNNQLGLNREEAADNRAAATENAAVATAGQSREIPAHSDPYYVLQQLAEQKAQEDIAAAKQKEKLAAGEVLKSLGNDVFQGVFGELAHSVYNIGTGIENLGEKYLLGYEDPEEVAGMFQQLRDIQNRDYKARQAQIQSTSEKSGVMEVVNNLIPDTARNLRDLALTLATGGGWAGVTAMGGEEALSQSILKAAQGTSAKVQSYIRQALQNPQFYSTVMETIGGSYEEAKEKGASDEQAIISSILSSIPNALIEVGGGSEEVVREIGSGGFKKGLEGLLELGKSALEEGTEEILQDTVSNVADTSVWDWEREWYPRDLTDAGEDSVFNAARVLTAAGYAAAGTVLTAGAGGVMRAGANRIMSDTDRVNVGSEVKKEDGGQRLLQIADRSENEAVQRQAKEIRGKLYRGENVSAYSLGRLAEAIGNDVTVDIGSAAREIGTAGNTQQQVMQQYRQETAKEEAVPAATEKAVPVQTVSASQESRQNLPQQINSVPSAEGYASSLGENGEKAFNMLAENLREEDIPGMKNAFEAFYKYGQWGQDIKNVDTSFRSFIDEAGAYAAYSAGQNDAEATVAKAQARLQAAENETQVKPGLAVNLASRAVSAAERSYLDQVGRAFNVSIEMYTADTAAEGNGYTSGGKIYLNTNSTNKLAGVVNHELTHIMQGRSPKEYQQYRNLVAAYVDRQERGWFDSQVERMIDGYAKRGQQITREEAVDEVVADASERFLSDEEAINALVKENRSVAQKVLDALREIIRKLSELVRGEGFDTRAAEVLSRDMEAYREAEKLWVKALSESSETQKTVGDSARYQLRKEFAEEFDAWDKKSKGGYFRIGTTSEALKSIGVKDARIMWDKSKIIKIMQKHPEMTGEVIKQVPQLLENPVVILQSKTAENRIVLLGEVYAGGKPVLAALELKPTNRQNIVMDYIKIASAYGKDSVRALFYDDWSNVLYLNPDRKRTDNWLEARRLQLPMGLTNYGPIRNVTYSGEDVKEQNLNKKRNNSLPLAAAPQGSRQISPDTKNVGGVSPAVSSTNIISETGEDVKEFSEGKKFQLVDYDERQKENWKNSKNIVLYESQEQFSDFIDGALSGSITGKKMYFGIVPKDLARKIKDVVDIETAGYNITLRSDEIRKIIKDHGNARKEAFRGQRGITKEDLLSIPNIIQSPDAIEDGGIYEGKPAIQFRKTIHGRTVVVTYVSRKHMDITVQTMYGGTKIESLATAADEQASANTPEALRGTTLNTYSIPQEQQLFNPENSEEKKFQLDIPGEGEEAFSSDSQLAEVLERDDDGKLARQLETVQAELTAVQNVPLGDIRFKEISEEILKEYGSAYEIYDLSNVLKDAYNHIRSRGASGFNESLAAVYSKTRAAVEQSRHLDDRLWNSESVKAARKKIRNTRLYISPEEQAAFPNYQQYRRENFGRFRLTNQPEDMTPRQLYAELAEEFPAYFSDTARGAQEQLEAIKDFLDAVKPVYTNQFQGSLDEAAADMAAELLHRVSIQAAEDSRNRVDYGEQQQAFQRQLYGQQREFEKQYQVLREELREKYSEKYKKGIQAVRKANKEAREKAAQRRATVQVRHKIEKIVLKLGRELENPTDTQHIPQEMRGAVAEFLKAIDFSSEPKHDKMGNPLGFTRKTEAWQSLLNYCKKVTGEENTDGFDSVYISIDPDLANRIDDLMQAGAPERLSTMSLQQAEELYKLVRAVDHMVRYADKVRLEGQMVSATETARGIIEDLDARGKEARETGKVRDKLDSFLKWEMMDPVRFADRMGETFSKVYGELRDGFDSRVYMEKEAAAYAEQLKEACGMDKKKLWKMEQADQQVVVGNRQVLMSKMQIMSLYLTNKREQGRKHLYSGGFSLPKTEIKGGKTITHYIEYHVTEADVEAIVGKLSDNERKFADGLQKFLGQNASEWGNRASLELYGYKKFTEKEYWPLYSDSNFVKNSKSLDEKKAESASIKNSGFTKALNENASNPVEIRSAMDVFSSHATEMAVYSAYVVPLENMNKVVNWQTRHGGDWRSVRKSMKMAYGVKAEKYLSLLLQEINGEKLNAKKKGKLSRATGFAKAAAIGGNLRVVAQQPTSYSRALDVVPAKYLFRALAPNKEIVSKKTVEEMYNIVPTARWKNWGFGGDGFQGSSLKELIMGKEKWNDRFADRMMTLAGKADDMTWRALYRAAVYWSEGEAGTKRGTEEWRQDVRKKFNEIVDRTQVYDSTFKHGQIFKTGTDIDDVFTAFMKEPVTNYNIMAGHIDQYSIAFSTYLAAKKAGNTAEAKAAKQKMKQEAKGILRGGIGIAVSGLLAAAFTLPIDLARDKDDDETIQEKVMQALFGESIGETLHGDKVGADKVMAVISAALDGSLLDNINPIGWIPYLAAIQDVIDGYDPEIMGVGALADVKDAGVNLWNSLSGKEQKYTASYYAYSFIRKLSVFSGIPVGNITRAVESAINVTLTGFEQITGIRTSKMRFNLAKVYHNPKNATGQAAYVQMMYDAERDGQNGLAQEIGNYLIEKGGLTYKQVQSKVLSLIKEDEESADLIVGYADAYMNYDYDKMEEIGEEAARRGMSPLHIQNAAKTLISSDKSEFTDRYAEAAQQGDEEAMAQILQEAQDSGLFASDIVEAAMEDIAEAKMRFDGENLYGDAELTNSYQYNALVAALLAGDEKGIQDATEGLLAAGKTQKEIDSGAKSGLKTSMAKAMGYDSITAMEEAGKEFDTSDPAYKILVNRYKWSQYSFSDAGQAMLDGNSSRYNSIISELKRTKYPDLTQEEIDSKVATEIRKLMRESMGYESAEEMEEAGAEFDTSSAAYQMLVSRYKWSQYSFKDAGQAVLDGDSSRYSSIIAELKKTGDSDLTQEDIDSKVTGEIRKIMREEMGYESAEEMKEAGVYFDTNSSGYRILHDRYGYTQYSTSDLTAAALKGDWSSYDRMVRDMVGQKSSGDNVYDEEGIKENVLKALQKEFNQIYDDGKGDGWEQYKKAMTDSRLGKSWDKIYKGYRSAQARKEND